MPIAQESLLSYYTLAAIDTFKVHIELFRYISPEEPCQARIELKFTPQQTDPARFQGQLLNAVFSVNGFAQKGREEERIFALEIAVNAIYRPIGSEPGFEIFNRAHTSLTRQLLPIMQRRAIALLQEVGLHHIQLPIDLVHAEPEKPTAIH